MIWSFNMKRSSLKSNTIFLYILTASNNLFSFVTIPYLTRVLEAESYGLIGFGMAFSTYIQLILDFGFILSATGSVSSANGDLYKISEVFTCVTICKLLLALLTGLLLIPILLYINVFNSTPLFYFLYYIYVVINSLVPDYVYRGLENMSIVTIRTVLIKLFFLIGVFTFVKAPKNYILVPLFYLLGSLFAVVTVFFHLKIKVKVWFIPVKITTIIKTIRDSSNYFISRIASTFYSSLNMLVLGTLFPGAAIVGYYSATNNAIQAGRSLASPLADSLYPYMIRTKNNSMLERIALIGEGILTIGCIIGWIYAPELCNWFFGSGYEYSALLLRIQIPVVPIALASYLFGFPALTPFGKQKVANLSVCVGAVLQVFILLILYTSRNLDAVTISYATVITELSVLVIRLFAYIKVRKNYI